MAQAACSGFSSANCPEDDSLESENKTCLVDFVPCNRAARCCTRTRRGTDVRSTAVVRRGAWARTIVASSEIPRILLFPLHMQPFAMFVN